MIQPFIRTSGYLCLFIITISLNAGTEPVIPAPSPVSSGPMAHLKTPQQFSNAVAAGRIDLNAFENRFANITKLAGAQSSDLGSISNEFLMYFIAFQKMSLSEGAQVVVARYQSGKHNLESLYKWSKAWLSTLEKNPKSAAADRSLRSMFETLIIPPIRSSATEGLASSTIYRLIDFVRVLNTTSALNSISSLINSRAQTIRFLFDERAPQSSAREISSDWFSTREVYAESTLETYELLSEELKSLDKLNPKSVGTAKRHLEKELASFVRSYTEGFQGAYQEMERLKSKGGLKKIERQATTTCAPTRKNNYCNACQRNGCQTVTTKCNDSQVVTKCGPAGEACASRTQCTIYGRTNFCKQNGFVDDGNTTPIIPLPKYSNAQELADACNAQHEMSHARDNSKTCSSAQSEAISSLIEQNCLVTEYNKYCASQPQSDFCTVILSRAQTALALSTFSDCLSQNPDPTGPYRYTSRACDICQASTGLPDRYVDVYCRAHARPQ